ncbi:hypothetical protein [Nocardia stercoris]|nr:hypothetical protein [Nocardia stercoris]
MELLLLLILPVAIAAVVVGRRWMRGRNADRTVVTTGNPAGKRYDDS